MRQSAKITAKTFELIHTKQYSSRITFNSMFVHVSRLIPKPLSRAPKICLERGDHESRINKNFNHVSREKNSPVRVSRKKCRVPSRPPPIPLCKMHSRKNIGAFYASRIIRKIPSRSRKNQVIHISR